MRVDVGVLGPLEVRVAGRPVELRSGKQRAVLAALALRAGALVSADRLVDAVWGERPPPTARSTLHAHVSRLRAALDAAGADDVVVTRPGGYLLDVPPEAVDAVRFERLVADARAALDRGSVTGGAHALAEALGAWRGTPLADVADGAFADAAATRLESLRLDATTMHAAARLDLGAADDVVADLEALVAAHPLHEGLWALLVRAFARCDRQAEALRTYERVRQVLADELGVDPGPELRRVHAELLRADAEAAEAAAAGGPPHNLPAPLTSFVGRQAETEDLSDLLDERRLVTLVGPGGAGKTRLALEAARAAVERFPDGVWFVDLTAVAAPDLLPDAIAGAVGVREQAGEDLTDRLVTALRPATALVVLDNCEHLVDACAHLADALLRSCPRLRVLATSREALGITGEVVRDVGGLTLPASPDPDGVAAADAVELLLQRARDVDPATALTAGNAAATAAVCQRLDGLPLALEIVAGQLRTRSLEDVAAMLDDRFRLEAAGARTAPARHRTLEAAIAWGCDLLTGPERTLLGRLSVFAGSFPEDAAAAVCADDGLEVGDLLPRLVDRSLVAVEDSPAERRFRLLETIRAYAREHLSPHDPAPLRAHLHGWARAVAGAAEPGLTGPEQQAWLDRLDRERDNLRAGLEWAAEADGPALARLATPLLLWWAIRGRMIEGERWLARAVESQRDPTVWRLRALNAWALALESVEGPSTRLDEALDEARRLGAELRAETEGAWTACWTGLVAMWRDLDAAREALIASADGFRRVGEDWGQGLAVLYLGHVTRVRGDYEEAERLAVSAEAVFAGLGERWGRAMCASLRGELARHRGDRAAARELVEAALADFVALDSPDSALVCLKRLARGARDDGDLEQARIRLTRALALARRAASATLVPETLVELGEVAWLAGDRTRAVTHLVEVTHHDVATAAALAGGLDLAALMAAVAGEPRSAVGLHAASAALRERAGLQPGPERQRRLDDAHRALRDELGADVYGSEWELGVDVEPATALRGALTELRELVSAGAPLSPSGGAPPAPGVAHSG